jgi:hypothetical protein
MEPSARFIAITAVCAMVLIEIGILLLLRVA